MPPGPITSRQEKQVMVKIPTAKVVTSMVTMYRSEDESLKKSAIEMAGFIVEAYDDKEQFKKDVFGSFVAKKSGLILGIQKDLERIYPEEAKALKEIFGAFLFGGN